jgi:hypothetical protein
MTKPIKWTRDNLRARAWFTEGRIFSFHCPRCGAVGRKIADSCSADLDARCPGFEAIEAAHRDFEESYHEMIREAPHEP